MKPCEAHNLPEPAQYQDPAPQCGTTGKSDRQRNASSQRKAGGFTLVELLVVLAVAFSLMLLVGLPLLNTLSARKLDGFARQTSVLMRKARLESIGNNVPTVVVIDVDREEVLAFGDVHNSAGDLLRPDYSYTPVAGLMGKDTDYQITRIRLPTGVDFSAPAGHAVMSGFTTKRPTYNADGIEVSEWTPWSPEGSIRWAPNGSDLPMNGSPMGIGPLRDNISTAGLAAAFWNADGNYGGTVETWGWEDATSSGSFSIDRPRLVFGSNGAVRVTGWIRVGDTNDNYLEIRVEPAATGKVRLRKWDRGSDEWRYQGEGGEAWEWY